MVGSPILTDYSTNEEATNDEIFSEEITNEEATNDEIFSEEIANEEATNDEIFSEELANEENFVEFKDIKDKLSKINNDLIFGATDHTTDKYQDYEELFKNKDEVYINNISQIFTDIKDSMYDKIIKERDQYKKIFNVVEEYVIKNNLLVCNLYKISNIDNNIDSLFDYYYVIYCEICLIHANNIINNIYEHIKKNITNETDEFDIYNADNPSTSIKFLNLKTLTKNEEFSIEYNNRTIVKLYTLQKYGKEEKIRVINAVVPYTINNINYIPPEIEIIDVYQKIYNGNQQYSIFEDILFKKIKNTNQYTGGVDNNEYGQHKHGQNKHGQNKHGQNKHGQHKHGQHKRGQHKRGQHKRGQHKIHNNMSSDIKHSLSSSYYEDDIEYDSDDDNKPKTCYEKKKDMLEAIKISFIKDFLRGRKDIMLIGANAYNWYVNGDNFCPNFDRLQIISNLTSLEIRNEINRFINDIEQKFKLSHGEELDLMIPKDFRTKRQVFSISIKTEKGMKIKPFIEYFNSAQFDIIPGMIKDDVLLGQKYVILRFLFIDLWIAKYVFITGNITEELYNKRIIRIWEVIKGVYVIPMITDLFLGIYKDYDVAKKQKNIENDVTYLPYYPNSYYSKHKKLREIK
jgi:hypothetical protein